MGCNGQWFMGPLWSATLKKLTPQAGIFIRKGLFIVFQ